MTDFSIRTVLESDLPALHVMNQAAVPHVNSLSEDAFADLWRLTAHAPLVERDGQPLGFVFAFLPGAPYASSNYRWFNAAFPSFVYVDRVIVDANLRASGVGKTLYADIEAYARGKVGAERIACEVNIVPPNERSMRFHTGLGFGEVGQLSSEDGAKQVSMLVKPLD